MKNLIRAELLSIEDYSRYFIGYASKEILAELAKHKKADQSSLKQVQTERDELKNKLKAETARVEALKTELEAVKKKTQEQPKGVTVRNSPSQVNN